MNESGTAFGGNFRMKPLLIAQKKSMQHSLALQA
jgi:hypothetical protein